MLYWRKVHAMRPHSSRILSRIYEPFRELTIIALDLLRDIQKVNNWNPGCTTRHVSKRRFRQ